MVEQTGAGERVVIPEVEERAVVDVQERPGETVRVRTTVETHRETISTPLTVEEFEVERVPIGRFVEQPVPVRSEGDTTIFSVHEEVTVTQKKLRVVEELRITRRKSVHQHDEEVNLRREVADIQKVAGN